jgi:hypothetical protein
METVPSFFMDNPFLFARSWSATAGGARRGRRIIVGTLEHVAVADEVIE